MQLAAHSLLPSFNSNVLGHLLFFPTPGTHWYLTFFWLVEFIEANWKKWSPFPATKWNRGTFAVAGSLLGTNSKGPGVILGHFDILKPFLKPISRLTDLVFKGGRYLNLFYPRVSSELPKAAMDSMKMHWAQWQQPFIDFYASSFPISAL